MANCKSTKKRIVLSAKQNERNKIKRTKLKSLLKNAIGDESKDTVANSYNAAAKYLDKMSTTGMLHKNKAAHKKSQLALHMNKVLSA